MSIHIYSACGNIIGLSQNNRLSVPPNHLKLIDQLIIYQNNHLTIYNQDGSLAKQCGNGLRALAHHLGPSNHSFYINDQIYHTHYQAPDHWVQFPLPTHSLEKHLHIPYVLINVGNLHALFDYKLKDQYPLLMPLLIDYNISFMKITNNIIEITTYERGVGYTESCGSAACAAAYLASLTSSNKTWKVKSKGGILTTTITDVVLQTGPVTKLEKIST